MSKTVKKMIALIMMISMVPVTPVMADKGTVTEDNAKNGSVEIEIVRDDRSIDPKKEFGFDGYVLKSYYETALLPDTVKNYEKINKAIEAKKEEFFSKDGYRKEVGIDELYGEIGTSGDPEWWFSYATVDSIYLDEKYYSVNMQFYSCFGGVDISVFRGYTFDLDTGKEVALKDVLGMNDSKLSSLLYDKVREYFTDDVGMNEYPASTSP